MNGKNSMMPLRPSLLALLAPLALGIAGCGAEDPPTAIVVSLDGDAPAVLGAVDSLLLIVDPVTPFLGSDGEPLGVGEQVGDQGEMRNIRTDDDELELVLTLDIDGYTDALPSVELRPGGSSEIEMVFSVQGFDGSTRTVSSGTVGPRGFETNTVVELTVPGVAVLDDPVTQCENGQDDDDDGWTDADDPDCASGDEETGYGETACNDGEDNDADGLIDAEDDWCDDASGEYESDPCDDGEDNDGDGWTDADDPDCATGDEELDFDDSWECNDGVDNDGDGDTDADDDDCDSAMDELEGKLPCDDGEDNDGDGWVDDDDPDCESGD